MANNKPNTDITGTSKHSVHVKTATSFRPPSAGSASVKIFELLGILRMVAFVGIGYRGFTHQSELQQFPFGISLWTLFDCAWALYALFLLTTLLQFRSTYRIIASNVEVDDIDSPQFDQYRHWVWYLIIMDTIFYSAFYILALKPESDLFLLFFIPMLNGIVLLDRPSSKKVWLVAVAGLLVSLALMYVLRNYAQLYMLGTPTIEKFFFHVFLIRAFAFFMASVPISLLITRSSLLVKLTKQLQQAHESVIRTEGLYHSLVDTIPQCIVRKNTEGYIVFASPGFSAFLGLPSETDVTGKRDEDFFQKDQVQQHLMDDEELLSGMVPIINKIERIRLKNSNKPLSIRVVKVPFKDADGNIAGIQVIFWDESDVQREKHKLLQWFLHDTPKPLTTIRDKYLYQLEKIGTTLATDKDRHEFSELCKKIGNIIDFTGASFHAYGYLGDPHKFDWQKSNFRIEEPLEIVLQVIKPNNPNIKFVITGPLNITISSDRNKIIALIYLLVENAVKAVSKPNISNPSITVGVEVRSDGLFLEVTDNGIGMSEDVRQRIFEEGFSKFGSSGLGLAIVKGFAVLSGGDVKMESREGLGSKFRVAVKAFAVVTT